MKGSDYSGPALKMPTDTPPGEKEVAPAHVEMALSRLGREYAADSVRFVRARAEGRRAVRLSELSNFHDNDLTLELLYRLFPEVEALDLSDNVAFGNVRRLDGRHRGRAAALELEAGGVGLRPGSGCLETRDASSPGEYQKFTNPPPLARGAM